MGDLSKFYNEDSDGDGLWNLEEWRLGSSPRDSTSGFSVTTKVAPSVLRILWQALDGYSYQVVGANRLGERFVPVTDLIRANTPVMTDGNYPAAGTIEPLLPSEDDSASVRRRQ